MWIEVIFWTSPLLAHWVVYFRETLLSTWDFHLGLGAEMKQQDHLAHSMRDRPLGFQGSAASFITPLFLISSFNRERGSRIAALEVISTEDFFSFPVPLHTPHRNTGNNRHVQKQRPIIKTLALLWKRKKNLFLVLSFSFLFCVAKFTW